MFLILGCGYTGRRVARTLAAEGHRVLATTRDPQGLALPGVELVRLSLDAPEDLEPLARRIEPGARVLHSVPLVKAAETWLDPTPKLLKILGDKPARVVYLSTTGVYGGQREIDETNSPAPRTPRERSRVEAENHVLGGPWSAMVLRPAAIYGPGRGIHVSMRRGEFKLLGEGNNFVSRIHVDDLAALAVAALKSEAGGAWPVADQEPARSVDIARFCSELLGLPMPPSAEPQELSETRRANRRVDGRAVCRLLGIQLRYPSYRSGIPAAVREEQGAD